MYIKDISDSSQIGSNFSSLFSVRMLTEVKTSSFHEQCSGNRKRRSKDLPSQPEITFLDTNILTLATIDAQQAIEAVSRHSSLHICLLIITNSHDMYG